MSFSKLYLYKPVMEIEQPLPRVTFVDREGAACTVRAAVGDSVMQTARSHGIPGIRADCGGFMSCGTCHVYVDPDHLEQLPPVCETEAAMLEGVAAERRPNSRLSCQLAVGPTWDLRVVLPDRQL